MFFLDLLFAFVVALVLALILIPLTASHRGREGTSAGGAILFFFLILFLATWAGGLWLEPMGPTLWGGYWLPFLLVGFFVALLLAATAEPSRHRPLEKRELPTAETQEAATAAMVFGVMFWVLLLALLAAVIAAYTI